YSSLTGVQTCALPISAPIRAPTTSRWTEMRERKELERRPDRRPAPPPAWDYAPAPESREIVSIKPSYGLFIRGEFVDPKSGRSSEAIDPLTEPPLAEVAEAAPELIAPALSA